MERKTGRRASVGGGLVTTTRVCTDVCVALFDSRGGFRDFFLGLLES